MQVDADGGGQVEDPVGAATTLSTAARSRMLPSMQLNPGWSMTPCRFSSRPVDRSSRTTTSSPRSEQVLDQVAADETGPTR